MEGGLVRRQKSSLLIEVKREIRWSSINRACENGGERYSRGRISETQWQLDVRLRQRNKSEMSPRYPIWVTE